jgi:hypothetical protein
LYDYFYEEVLPEAIRCGMPVDEFWHGDMRLLKSYQMAYYRNISYSSWLQGYYNFEAYSKALSNSNRSKKTDPVAQYSQWRDPMADLNKPKITKENLEEEFRKEQIRQNDWLFKR